MAPPASTMAGAREVINLDSSDEVRSDSSESGSLASELHQAHAGNRPAAAPSGPANTEPNHPAGTNNAGPVLPDPREAPGFTYRSLDDVIPEQAQSFNEVWADLLESTIPGSVSGGGAGEDGARGGKLDNNSSYNMWRLVFLDGWNSERPISRPPTLPARLGSQAMFLCGFFHSDLPTSGARDAIVTPPRREGQPAYVKIHVRGTGGSGGAIFVFCDSEGRTASADYVTLFGGTRVTSTQSGHAGAASGSSNRTQGGGGSGRSWRSSRVRPTSRVSPIDRPGRRGGDDTRVTRSGRSFDPAAPASDGGPNAGRATNNNRGDAGNRPSIFGNGNGNGNEGGDHGGPSILGNGGNPDPNSYPNGNGGQGEKVYKVGHFLAGAISQYDLAELSRVKSFNVRLAVHIVRSRLKHWTLNGWLAGRMYSQGNTPVALIPDNEDDLRAKFEKLVLARENGALWGRCAQDLELEEMISEAMDPCVLSIPGMGF